MVRGGIRHYTSSTKFKTIQKLLSIGRSNERSLSTHRHVLTSPTSGKLLN